MGHLPYTIEEIHAILKPIADKYDVTEMYLFGSYARSEADEKSDIDFAVQDEGTKLMGMAFYGFQEELEDAFGCSVDLIEVDCVHVPVTRFPDRFGPRFERDKMRIL
ncbi:MAG: nucleotidyltransferase domain-containing protein [Oscillospiraceae bacterium]|nr:nucleotidyltransferase domain-containing protein [Oscillospiraceae bacterium]